MHPRRRTAPLVAGVAAILLPAVPFAALLDRGPVNPGTGFPAWYRDTTGAAVELCLAQTPSPNASAGGAPMCFPWVPDPAGYAGNFGDEQFYMAAGAALSGPGFSARLDLALEAAYQNGTPIRGDEMVFARVRVVMSVPAAGTYQVIHPYGTETLVAEAAGQRAISFTRDVGLVPGQFDDALNGSVGPFLEWDLAPGEIDPADGAPYSLTVGAESYLGDPNIDHAIKGSPFGTNFFRVTGPAGIDLDGNGHDFVETSLFALVGKRYTTPIPAPMEVDRAVYGHDGAQVQIDLFARGAPGQSLVMSGSSIPTTALAGDGTGRYFGHLVYASAGLPAPRELILTNLTDAPPTSIAVPLKDVVTIWSSTYDPTTQILSVTAFSSDAFDPTGPALVLAVPGGGIMSPMEGNPTLKTIAVLTAAPVGEAKVESASGGVGTQEIRIAATAPVDPGLLPIAADDSATTAEDTAIAIAVLANDTPATGSVILLSSPSHGGASVDALTGDILYTPAPNYFGGDALSYMVMDAAGAFSNAAVVAITVTPVNDPPIAANDSATTQAGTPVTVAVLANDTDVDGLVVPGTVAIAVQSAGGTATPNADGTITFVPNDGFSGTTSIAYTVQDDAGATSNAATVTLTVLNQAEQLTVQKAQYETSKQRWTVTGQSSVSGAGINNTVTIYNGPTTAYPALATLPIDIGGKFQWQPAPGSAPAPDSTRLITIRSTGGGQITVSITVK